MLHATYARFKRVPALRWVVQEHMQIVSPSASIRRTVFVLVVYETSGTSQIHLLGW
jgi:hypothetical protein